MPCCGSVPKGPMREPSAITTSACAISFIAALDCPGSPAGRPTAGGWPGSVVAQVAGDHRCAQALGQCLAFFHRVAHHHATAGQDDRELGRGQQLGGGR
jgi:hypothetical protein